MNRVVHFEIHAANPDRAAAFYKEMFGWEFTEWAPGDTPQENRYWLISTGPQEEAGIGGGMVARRPPDPAADQPVGSFVSLVDVEDVDACLKKMQICGGTVTVPKIAIAGVGWCAYCKDTEGNLFGIFQDDEKAK